MLGVFLRTSDSILSDCRKLANMIARQTPNSVVIFLFGIKKKNGLHTDNFFGIQLSFVQPY